MYKFTFNNTHTVSTILSFVQLKDFIINIVDEITTVESNGYHGKYSSSTLHKDFGLAIWQNDFINFKNKKIPSDSMFYNYLVCAENESVIECVHNHLDLLGFTVCINLEIERCFDNWIKGRFLNTQALKRLLHANLPNHTFEQFITENNVYEVCWAYYDKHLPLEGKFLNILEDCMNHSERNYINNGKIKIPNKYYRST